MDKTVYIDINCDVGEGVGNENGLLPLISSCNIACGGHAGDEQTMREVVALGKKHRVKIGAHPSYPDREHFGRISMAIAPDHLIASIRDQIGGLELLLNEKKVALHHIKPHGALYNDIAKDASLARTFLRAIEGYREDIFIYLPHQSAIETEALKMGFRIKYEAFADRNYKNDLSLVPRNEKDALIQEPERVLAHLLTMVNRQRLRTSKGEMIQILADTYCIHGDTPAALQILMYLSAQLPNYNIEIRK